MDKSVYFFIIGPEEKKLKEAVQSLANLYANTEFTKGISVFKSDKNKYVINFRNNPEKNSCNLTDVFLRLSAGTRCASPAKFGLLLSD